LARKAKTSPDPLHYPLTKYERARIIGGRALQLSLGAFPLVEVREGDTPIDLATRELESGSLPIIIRRRKPNGEFADVALKDLLVAEEA